MEAPEKYYRLLGVTPGSSLQEINQAYVHALTQLHPDRLSDEPGRQRSAQARIREINEAYVAIKKLYHSPGNPAASPDETAGAFFPPVPSAPRSLRRMTGTVSPRKPFRFGRLVLLVLLAVPLTVAALRFFGPAPASRHSPPPAPPAPSVPVAPYVAPPPPAGPTANPASPDDKSRGVPATARQVAKERPAARKGTPAAKRTAPPASRQQRPSEHADELATRAARVKEAAEDGDAAAQARLGTFYMTGSGVRQDYGEAATWYNKAAENEFAPAQTWLGYLYATGTGTRQDLKEAATWYRRAANQKDVIAQLWLGYLYATGKGVPQDFGEAAAWYRRAAEQGHATAQVWLGYLYETGKGVPQDFGEALMWYYRAAQHGDATAREHLARLSKGANRAAKSSS